MNNSTSNFYNDSDHIRDIHQVNKERFKQKQLRLVHQQNKLLRNQHVRSMHRRASESQDLKQKYKMLKELSILSHSKKYEDPDMISKQIRDIWNSKHASVRSTKHRPTIGTPGIPYAGPGGTSRRSPPSRNSTHQRFSNSQQGFFNKR